MSRGWRLFQARVTPVISLETAIDTGFKHTAFILGAPSNTFRSATVRAYEPLYGTGGAVVEFHP